MSKDEEKENDGSAISDDWTLASIRRDYRDMTYLTFHWWSSRATLSPSFDLGTYFVSGQVGVILDKDV